MAIGQRRKSQEKEKDNDIEKQARYGGDDSEVEESHDEDEGSVERQAEEDGDDDDDNSNNNDDVPDLEGGADGGGGGGGGLTSVLSRVLTRTSVKSVPPGPPPDGGVQAWMTVACVHLVTMNTWGFIGSFGVFQSYYATSLGRPPADISWIGSFQIFLLFFIGTATGRLTDAGYFRPVFFSGVALQLLGLFSSSWAGGSYWQLFLAQGVAMGVGNGCMFLPCMAIVSTYFEKRRALAIGIVACGSATGGLVFPSMARELLGRVGFAWTIRAIGFVQAVTLVGSGLLVKPRVRPRRGGAWLELEAFREGEYTLYMIGSFMCFLGLFFGFYYIASYSRTFIGLSYEDSLNLLLVLNGVGSVGRLIPNSLADRFGPMTIFVPTATIGGLSVLCWPAVHSVAGMYVWAVFYGMAAGGIQSLFPAGLTSMTSDPRKTGVRMGMVFSVCAFATLIGPPIAGAIITASAGRYIGAQMFAGVSILSGAGFMAAARVVRVRRMGAKWTVKV
ncbi:major facilitator superfamily domain-containing protein [Echria macrotheca]|uniref:Major facilitator superfamily domain-containing protein n=1 Tax=Echria macrotheca TaxID=438768 RepID=A0AAJ0BD95_9PEZI|nr:major facilitator superfamily domain-containing protein [Echria macrotheca]